MVTLSCAYAVAVLKSVCPKPEAVNIVPISESDSVHVTLGHLVVKCRRGHRRFGQPS